MLEGPCSPGNCSNVLAVLQGWTSTQQVTTAQLPAQVGLYSLLC